MKLYTFICNKITNVWAGIGARRWAVSSAEKFVMKARVTRSKSINIGNFGIIYLSETKEFTKPFIFTSISDPQNLESEIWPEAWAMPFSIFPLGSPLRRWSAIDALNDLPCAKANEKTGISSVFKLQGTAVFSPLSISEKDWEIILDRLSSEIR